MNVASQVLSLRGEVFAVDAAGRRRPLHAKDRIAAGERIELAEDAQVQLLGDDGRRIVLDGIAPRQDEAPAEMFPPADTATVRKPRSALEVLAREERLKNFQPEAGVQAGEAENGGHTVVFVERLREIVPGGYHTFAGPGYVEARHLDPWDDHLELTATRVRRAAQAFVQSKNTPAWIEEKTYQLMESQRHQRIVLAAPDIKDADPGENRLQAQEWRVLQTADGRVWGRYRVDAEQLVFDIGGLPQLSATDRLTARLDLTSIDGTKGSATVIVIGENDVARIEPGRISVRESDLGPQTPPTAAPAANLGDLGAPVRYGTDGDDKVDGTVGNDKIHGRGGNDTIHGKEGDDQLFGDDGDDDIDCGPGEDKAYGGRGKDHIEGKEGNDRVHGGDDDDVVDGGLGSDWITLGRGRDTAVWTELPTTGRDVDTIIDFQRGEDVIDLHALFKSHADIQLSLHRWGASNQHARIEINLSGHAEPVQQIQLLEVGFSDQDTLQRLIDDGSLKTV